jgi:hypothetical protein
MSACVALGAAWAAGCSAKADPETQAPTAAEVRRSQRHAELQALAEQRAARAEAARRARAAEDERVSAAAREPIVYDREKNRELAEWGERTRRDQERREREAFGKVLSPAEREEVAKHGKLLTEEERAEIAKEEAEKLAAEREAAAKAAADAAAVAAAQPTPEQRAAAERQRQIENLSGLAGDQFVRERTRLLREGVIDEGTDYRDPTFDPTADD